LSLAGFQLAEDFQEFAAKRHRHAELLTFINDIREGEVDFGAKFFLDVAQRAFAVFGFPGFGELVYYGEALVGRLLGVRGTCKYIRIVV